MEKSSETNREKLVAEALSLASRMTPVQTTTALALCVKKNEMQVQKPLRGVTELERDKRVFSIYAIRCKANGKVYIGQTQDVSKRVRQHWSEKRHASKISKSKTFMGGLTPFEKDFEAYGEDGFEVYVLESSISNRLARTREEFWIQEYKSTDQRFGYNKIRSCAVLDTAIIHALPPNLSKA